MAIYRGKTSQFDNQKGVLPYVARLFDWDYVEMWLIWNVLGERYQNLSNEKAVQSPQGLHRFYVALYFVFVAYRIGR